MQCRRDRGPGLRKRPEPVEDFLLDAHRKSALRDEPSAVSKSVEHAAMQCSTQPRPSTIFKSRRKELFANCARRAQGEPARLGAILQPRGVGLPGRVPSPQEACAKLS